MINNRDIPCACGDPKCQIGISFDVDDKNETILRFHDKYADEIGMKIDKETAKKLIEALSDFT